MKVGTRRFRGRAKSAHLGARRDLEESADLRADLTGIDQAKAPAAAIDQRTKASLDKHQWALLHGSSCAITAQLDLGASMRTILAQAIKLMGAERGILFLGRPEPIGFVPVMAANLRGQELEEVETYSRTVLNLTESGGRVVTDDALADPRLKNARSISRGRMRSVACAPLTSPAGQVGAIYLDSPMPDAFPRESIDLLDALGRIAATAIENARLHSLVVRENAWIKATQRPRQMADRVLGHSARIDALRQQATVAALMNQTVIIVGEPGTGRRLLAQAIHEAGRRAYGPFVTCEATAFIEPLLSGALLGRLGVAVKGAFNAEPGLVRQADTGTLCLVEAWRLEEGPAKLVYQLVKRGVFRPLGGRRDERVDVRVILTTQPDPHAGGQPRLPAAFSTKATELQLNVPPLRERPEDIPAIALDFIRSVSEPGLTRSTPTFTASAIVLLQQQMWPGNVLDLQQVLRRILLLHTDPVIDVDQVKEALASVRADGQNDLGPWSGRTLLLRDWEHEAIRQALVRCNGNRAAAARLLGIHRNTLVMKTKAMGLD